jgi:hypothetical protein
MADETDMTQMSTNRLKIPYNVAPATGAGSSLADQFKDFADESGPNSIKAAHPWTDEEYEKHISGLRARYPMLTEYILRGHPLTSANLSDIQTTNKYARLADAYNAQMRYVAGDWQSGGKAGEGSERVGMGHYEQVPQLETQDQKQMEQLRQAQADMRKYQLGEESYFQRDVWDRKADEMAKLVNESYERQFWNSNEQRRRISAQFDAWQHMNETEFNQVMTQLGIPEQKVANAKKLLDEGRYLEYAQLMDAYGLTPMSVDQVYTYTMTRGIIQRLVSNDITPQEAAASLGQLNAMYVINSIYGFVDAAKNDTAHPAVQKAGIAAENAISSVADLTGSASEHLPAILAVLGATSALSGLASFFGPIATAIIKAKG